MQDTRCKLPQQHMNSENPFVALFLDPRFSDQNSAIHAYDYDLKLSAPPLPTHANNAQPHLKQKTAPTA
eukprot:2487386-Amphidinium_carterae.1